MFLLCEVDKLFEHEVKCRDDDRGYCCMNDRPHHENFSEVKHYGKVNCHIQQERNYLYGNKIDSNSK